jgi:hypothetical protein
MPGLEIVEEQEAETGKEIKSTDLRPRVLYRSRLSTDTVFCLGAEFDVQALSVRDCEFIRSAQPEGWIGGRGGVLVALGVTAIRGLVDEDGASVEPEFYTVTILARERRLLTPGFLEHLDLNVIEALIDAINDLTALSNDERLKLDFIRQSQL